MHPENLTRKIEDRTAKICIVGLGYAGLPTAVAFCEQGFEVLGVDVDRRKVDAINRGESPLKDMIVDAHLKGLEGKL
ncbi:MAG: UDP-N-acetyl-D-glucosamine dehydrogenase, partial [Thermoplasmata archaeon]